MAGDINNAAERLWKAKQEKDRCNAAWAQAKANGFIPDAVHQANNKADKDYKALIVELREEHGDEGLDQIDGIVQNYDRGHRGPRGSAPKPTKPVEDSEKQAREAATESKKKLEDVTEREKDIHDAAEANKSAKAVAEKGKKKGKGKGAKKSDSENPTAADAEGNPMQGNTSSPLGFESQNAMPLEGLYEFAVRPGQEWWSRGTFMNQGWFQCYWDKGYEEGKKEIIMKEAIDDLRRTAAAINSANGAKKGDKNYIDLDDDKKCAKLVQKAADEGKRIFISPKGGEPEVISDEEYSARMDEFSMDVRGGLNAESPDKFARDLQALVYRLNSDPDREDDAKYELALEDCDKLYDEVKEGGRIVFGRGGEVAAVNEGNHTKFDRMVKNDEFKPLYRIDVSPASVAPTLTAR